MPLPTCALGPPGTVVRVFVPHHRKWSAWARRLNRMIGGADFPKISHVLGTDDEAVLSEAQRQIEAGTFVIDAESTPA